jgi:hypothetical protein
VMSASQAAAWLAQPLVWPWFTYHNTCIPTQMSHHQCCAQRLQENYTNTNN